MKERWIVALAIFYFVLILGGGLVVGQYFLHTIENQVTQTPTYTPYPYTGPLPTPGGAITVTNVTVTHQDSPRYQGAYKPYVITTNMTAVF